jgi:cysteine desulfurase family protein (TIGR01976 family)
MAAVYDVQALRARFPSLAGGTAYLDGPGGTQTPDVVGDAVRRTLTQPLSNRGDLTPAERNADEAVVGARRAMADLLGAVPEGVVFGRSMTQLTMDVSRALAKEWGPGDEVVVTRLDHDANVRPWVAAAERAGATVRWLGIDRQSCRLDDIHAVLSDRTRVVAVTAASNAVGTRPDVREIADAAHALGALVYVDGVHLTPHAPVDVAALGADFFAFSAYKICGPHVASVVADPALLATLQPDKLDPAPTTPAGRFERGTAPFELLAGVTATVDFLAGLVPAAGNRRARVLASMTALEGYESALFGRLRAGLEGLERVTTYGAAARRTPTIGVRVDGWTPRQVAEALGARGIAVWDGHFYAVELIRALGLADSGGIVRIGLAHYSTYAEVDRLLGALAGLAATPPGSDTMTHSVGSEPTE